MGQYTGLDGCNYPVLEVSSLPTKKNGLDAIRFQRHDSDDDDDDDSPKVTHSTAFTALLHLQNTCYINEVPLRVNSSIMVANTMKEERNVWNGVLKLAAARGAQARATGKGVEIWNEVQRWVSDNK